MSEGTAELHSIEGGETSVDEAVRGLVVKASVIGEHIMASAASAGENVDKITALFKKKGVVKPAYPPHTLMRIFENSSALRQNVEAYQTNIDGLGWRLEACIDFDQEEESHNEVREAIWYERMRKAQRSADEDLRRLADDPDTLVPSDADVSDRIMRLRRQMRLEKFRVESFLKTVNAEGSFTSLRRETRMHLEVTGNAYWEVLRNMRGEVARFVLVPPTHVRLLSKDDDPTKVIDRAPMGILGWDTVPQLRFFRRYVQAVGGKTVYFKQFGDPRVVSRMTGKIYENRKQFEADTKRPDGDAPATEMIHFKIDHIGEPYGAPRWIGNLLAVLGSRAADEVNWTYFDNKAVPPLALLVSGGTLHDETVQRIENYIKERIKGRKNFHSILVVEAVPPADQGDLVGHAPPPTVKFEKLMDAQQGDALFQNYDERNIDKVGSAFRLPRLMRGDVRDFNRATAVASLRFAETQVFEPERMDWDDWFNRTIMPELDAHLWKFRSNALRSREPEVVVDMAEKAVKQGIITPNEGREFINDALPMRDLPPRPEFWAKQPLQLTLVGIRPDDPESGPGGSTSQQPVEPADGETQPMRTLANQGRAMNSQREALNEANQAAAVAQREEVDKAITRLDELADNWISGDLLEDEEGEDGDQEG